MLESIISDVKQIRGIVPLSEYEQIDECRQGCLTTTLEWMTESFGGESYVRLRTTLTKPGSRIQRAFAWPVKDPQRPIEVYQIAENILRAARPDATVTDPRGLIGRCFDRLLGVTHINYLPHLVQSAANPKTTLTATIRATKSETSVSLVHRIERRSAIWIHLPLQSIAALKARLAPLVERCGQPDCLSQQRVDDTAVNVGQSMVATAVAEG